MENSLTIQIPKGFEIDKEKSTFEKIIFKKKDLDCPKDWKDLKELNGYFIDDSSDISNTWGANTKNNNKNIIPTESLANAMLALCQLLQLRNYVWKNICNDWELDKIGAAKYSLLFNNVTNEFFILTTYNTNRVLVFPNSIIANKFMIQYKDLIEKAKELL